MKPTKPTLIGNFLLVPYSQITYRELTYFTDVQLDADAQIAWIKVRDNSKALEGIADDIGYLEW